MIAGRGFLTKDTYATTTQSNIKYPPRPCSHERGSVVGPEAREPNGLEWRPHVAKMRDDTVPPT